MNALQKEDRANFDARVEQEITGIIAGGNTAPKLGYVAGILMKKMPEGQRRSGDKFGWMHVVRNSILRSTVYTLEKTPNGNFVRKISDKPSAQSTTRVEQLILLMSKAVEWHCDGHWDHLGNLPDAVLHAPTAEYFRDMPVLDRWMLLGRGVKASIEGGFVVTEERGGKLYLRTKGT